MISKGSNRIKQQISSVRVFSFLFLAILAVGIAVAPLRLAAQQAVPAAGSQAAAPVTATPEGPKTQEEQGPKSEEEQSQAFRLEGPLVKWTAKTFNLTVETAATIFEFTNFALIVLLVGIPIARVLPRIFHKRSETLVYNLKTAREATADANARLSAVEAKLAGLDDEIKKFRIQVEQESKEDEARIKASLAEESARIVESAEQELGAAAAHARRSLRSFAADLAIEQAAKQLVLTPETDRALIAEFIGDVSSNGTKKGGQN